MLQSDDYPSGQVACAGYWLQPVRLHEALRGPRLAESHGFDAKSVLCNRF